MAKTISDNNKSKRGRPVVNSTFVGVRFPPNQLAELDAWISKQKEPLTRPQAIRQLVAKALYKPRTK